MIEYDNRFLENLPVGLDVSLLKALMGQPLLGVSLCDADFKWLFGNQAWHEITAVSTSQPRSLFTLLPSLEPIIRPFFPKLAVGQAIPRQPVQIERNGSFAYWEIALTPLMVAGKLSGIVFVLVDNTDDVRIQKRLERRIADHTQKLSALYDVITATAEAPDLRSTLNWSLQRVLEAIQCSAGMIHLIDDFDIQSEPKALRLVTQQGLPDEAVRVLAETAVDSTLFGLAMFSGHPIVIPNLATHPIAPVVVRQQPNLQTYVGTAMAVRDRTVGILSVFAENGRYFGKIELALLDSVADQIGIVVENSYLHKQAEETAVAEERHRLARELHDSVTQAIYSLTLFTEAGLRLVRSGSYERIEELLTHLNTTSQQALREMRVMLHKLRPPDLDEEGLAGALQHRLDEVEARANVEAHLIIEGNVDDLPDLVEEQLYRIAQEALNNALKHSAASLLTVRISADDDDVIMEIHDDGKGFDVGAAQDTGGMGLHNMEERTEELDGEWTIKSTPGKGTTISVQIDLDALELDEEALF